MKAALLMRLVAPVAWGNQQTPKDQSKEMAEVACLFQYELIHSRFTLGLSEEEAVKTSSNILKEYLEKKKEMISDHNFSWMSKDVITQLREIETNPEAVQKLKSPPSDFKDKFLSSCIETKTQKIEFLHVFG